MTLLLLTAGVVALTAGAELLVRGSARLAAVAGVSRLVIGLTVVAFGTSAPELAVSVSATFRGQDAIAVGNVVGSNTFNVLFILGVSALVAPLVVQRQLVRLDVPVMIVTSLLLVPLALDGMLGPVEGAAMVGALVLYTVMRMRLGRQLPDQAPVSAVPNAEQEAPQRRHAAIVHLLAAAAGPVLLVFGSRLFLNGAVSLAQQLGVSEQVIGLTIVAAGTSLPELATSVVASARGERDIAIGNVVGSNIFNILGILGVCGLIGGVQMEASFFELDVPVMIAAAVATLPIITTGLRISRAEGVFFVGYYIAYTVYLVLQAGAHDLVTNTRFQIVLLIAPAAAAALALISETGAKPRRQRSGRAV